MQPQSGAGNRRRCSNELAGVANRPGSSAASMGLDSLMATRTAEALGGEFRTHAPATLVWGHPTISALAAHLLEKLDLPAGLAMAAAAVAPEQSTDVAELSEDEAELLLMEELAKVEKRAL